MTPAPQSRSRLIVPTEPLLPWLAASVLAASAYTAGIVAGLAGARMPWVVLTVACCSVLTATVLVWWRAKRVQREVRQTELSRPAPEELATWAADSTLVDAGERHLPPYGEGMLRYSAAVVVAPAVVVMRNREVQIDHVVPLVHIRKIRVPREEPETGSVERARARSRVSDRDTGVRTGRRA